MRHKGNEEGRGGENWRETGRGTVREGLGRRRVLPGCWGAAMERKEKRRRWAKRWQLRKGTIWRFPVLGDRFGRVSEGFGDFGVQPFMKAYFGVADCSVYHSKKS